MDIFTITIGVSLILFIAIGNFAGKRVKDLDDYFVAGRRAPTILIVGTLVASVMSSVAFLGEAGFTYDGQLGAYMLFPSTSAAGYVIGALFFGRYLRRSRATTVADFFGQRFNSFRLQRVSGIIIMLSISIYLLIVTQGASILLTDLTELGYVQSLIVVWLSYTFFTLYAGSKGVIITDTLMFLLFTGATLVFAYYIVSDLGGLARSIENMAQLETKPGIASWSGIVGPGTDWPTAMDYLIWAFVIDFAWAAVYIVGPWQAGRHLMARDEHVVLRSSMYALIIVALLQIIIYGLGGIVNLVKTDITPSETVLVWAARNLVPEFLGALVLAGIMAAALSSASTFLSLVGFSASNDVVKRKKALNLRSIRIIMMWVGIVVLLASFYFPPNIFWLMLFVGTVYASSWGPVGLMSIWSKSITESAAYWGMITGFVFNVIPAAIEYLGYITWPSYLHPALIGTVISLITIGILSKRSTVTEQERAYRVKLHITPEEDCDARKTRITMIAPVVLFLYGCTMPFIVVNYYIKPYQRGSGEILADGSMNWQTGEAWFSLAPAVVFISLGILAAVVIRRSYNSRASSPS
ncbi:MAG: sodium:solute symporter family protein [Gammaproteobacteria bacterium]|jgi:Na+/proline symporter|nr:sodium:solute symporter family protein [Gammaproteobacteria bacterium]MBT6246695.1 sodium:solute symporter family protein [Gammaproteobacteria bacterium]